MFLTALVKSTKKRVELAKKVSPPEKVKALAEDFKKRVSSYENCSFEEVFRREGISFICEIKKASPSKGIISAKFPYKKIACEYEEAGAHAISVLTEPEYFLGSSKHLQEIKALVGVPVLRKDFIVDEYQIYESKLMGADAVLLICALLDAVTLKRYIEICDSIGLSHLAEVRNDKEVFLAIDAGARVIGINNRNLENFKVDIENSLSLKKLVPPDKVCVAESGIKTREEIKMLEKRGINGVLIGEVLMKSKDKKAKLLALMGKKVEDDGGG